MESQKKLEEDAALLISALETMKAQLEENYTVERLTPEHKDWNDDLTAQTQSRNEVMPLCQTFG